jgi:hypothetical protein
LAFELDRYRPSLAGAKDIEMEDGKALSNIAVAWNWEG